MISITEVDQLFGLYALKNSVNRPEKPCKTPILRRIVGQYQHIVHPFATFVANKILVLCAPRKIFALATLAWYKFRYDFLHKAESVKKFISTALISCALGLSSLAYAGQGEFCAGFEEGYKIIKGDIVIVPICPIAPITPIGSTDFREGIKAGIRAASR